MEGKAYGFLILQIYPDKDVFYTENLYISETEQKDL
jgi:hypothetical protein